MKINKFKKTIALSVLSILLFTSNSISFAEIDSNTLNENYLIEKGDEIKQLNSIVDKYGGELTVGQDVNANQPVIKVNSLEEFEDLIKTVREELPQSDEKNIVETTGISPYAIGFKTVTYKAGVFKWLYTRAMDFNYETKVVNGKTQLERVYNRRSYPQGLTALAWKEKWHHAPVYNSARTSVSMKVDGEWRLGVEYNGMPVGYTFSDTWNFSYSM
jgi:hypothetical protein